MAAVLAVLALLAATCDAMSFDRTYGQGIIHYRDEQWKETVSTMQKAASEYSEYTLALEVCVDACTSKEPSLPVDYPPEPQLHWFHSLIERASCLQSCMAKEGWAEDGGTSEEVCSELKRGEPYNYLQMSLWNLGSKKEASLAAARYLGMNPFNEKALSNMELYRSHVGEGLRAETPPYVSLYTQALVKYNDEEYSGVTDLMEQSLQEFLDQLKTCRTLCDGPLSLREPLEFSRAISHYLMAVLECRIQCTEQLGKFPRDTEDDILTSYFRYLQFSYFQLKDHKKAVQAFVIQQRLGPETDEIRNNLKAYSKMANVTKEDWEGRKDVVHVVEQLQNEKALLAVLRRFSQFDTNEAPPPAAGDGMDQQLLDQDYIDHPVGLVQTQPLVVEEESSTEKQRVVFDQLADEQQCRMLMELARSGTEGDGYQSRTPHTKHEKFEGLTTLSAAEAAQHGDVNASVARLYLDLSELGRRLVQEHFNLTSHLHYSYTHLVCRTANSDAPLVRSDLSHPVHADNCVLDQNLGVCDKVPPAYTWRDYSAILYLNEDFQGGKFFFAHGPKDLSPEQYVTPKCGRMVGFSAGPENMHGVTAVTKGRRCAVALWFTLDPEHKEETIENARKILDQYQGVY